MGKSQISFRLPRRRRSVLISVGLFVLVVISWYGSRNSDGLQHLQHLMFDKLVTPDPIHKEKKREALEIGHRQDEVKDNSEELNNNIAKIEGHHPDFVGSSGNNTSVNKTRITRWNYKKPAPW